MTRRMTDPLFARPGPTTEPAQAARQRPLAEVPGPARAFLERSGPRPRGGAPWCLTPLGRRHEVSEDDPDARTTRAGRRTRGVAGACAGLAAVCGPSPGLAARSG